MSEAKKPTAPATAPALKGGTNAAPASKPLPAKPAADPKPVAKAETPADGGTAKPAAAKKKTECPVTRESFAANAQPVKVDIGGGGAVVAGPKQFSTGSVGWWCNEKVTIEIDGVPVKCQANVSITVIGSKELPKGDA